jgi:predicted transcriptional regulator
VLLTAQAFERIEQALEEHEAKRVIEIVEAGLASHEAGRTATHAVVARRMRRARARRK